MDFGMTNCPDDDWGCVGPDELFFASGPTPSFRSLIEKLETMRQKDSEEDAIKNVTTKFNQLDSKAIRKADALGKVEIIRDIKQDEKADDEGIHNGGILKKSLPNDGSTKSTSLKRVTFEIERFVASKIGDRDERLSAEQKLVMKLGAKAPRRKAENYKKLKEQRLEAKKQREEGGLDSALDQLLLHRLNGGKVNKKKKFQGRKRQRRGGILKKGSKNMKTKNK